MLNEISTNLIEVNDYETEEVRSSFDLEMFK